MNKCLNCNKDTNNPKFCSKSCAAKVNNKLTPKRHVTRICSVCQEKPSKSSKHNTCKDCMTRPRHDEKLPLSFFRNKPSVQGKHPSWRNVHIRQHARNKFKHLLKQPCHSCGYDKHVEICHIKPLSEFPDTATLGEVNSFKNIIQLCPNCHWELDHPVK